MTKRIAIVGGGIIGLCSAYYLQKLGHEVAVFDKHDFDDSCSHGNAGMIVPSHCIPLASPGIISKGLRWMFKSSSPFYIHPQLGYPFLRWLYLFYRSCNPKHVDVSIPLLADMSLKSKELWQELAADINIKLEQKGILMLYKSEAVAEEEYHTAKIAAELGLENRLLNQQELQGLESTQIDALGAVHYTCDAHIAPNGTMKALKQHLSAAGVVLHHQAEVVEINVRSANKVEISTKFKTQDFNELIIASGFWSSELLKSLDLCLPMLAGKGYSIDLPQVEPQPSIPSILCEAKVAMTPFQNEFRVAGTMELGSRNTAVNSRRVSGIINSIQAYYPDFDVNPLYKQKPWSGFRPCSPDGLPFIGTHPKYKNVKIATGHAMMGLSMAPVTGLYISEMIQGNRKSIPKLEPYRFS